MNNFNNTYKAIVFFHRDTNNRRRQPERTEMTVDALNSSIAMVDIKKKLKVKHKNSVVVTAHFIRVQSPQPQP